jgi:hypothetical protein
VTLTYNDETLALDTDYTVEYTNNTAIGTATATITGIGNYKGTVTKTFNIVAATCQHANTDTQNENEVAATCKAAGSYDEVTYCTDCQEEIKREFVSISVDATAHVWDSDYTVDKEATCTELGKQSIHCSLCDAVTKEEDIPATGHMPDEAVKENEVAAKCNKAGSYDEVVYCTECGTELSRKTVETDKIAHTPDEAVKENEVTAKCDQQGSYDEVVYCTKCGEELSRKTVETAMIAHTWNVGTVTKSATCTATGVKTYTCTVCKATKTETVKALGHTYTTTVVAPTYTTEGYTLHECTRCNDSYKSDVTAKLSYLKGDVDGDGAITLMDVTLLFQYVNKQITQDKVKVFAAADVDGNGKVELQDVTKLFQYVNNKITKYKLKVFDAADVNGDGKVTLKDVTKVFQYVNNQIASL